MTLFFICPIINSTKASKKSIVPRPLELEMTQFYQSISKCGSKAAILSLVEPFSDAYVPREFSKEFPQLIPDFRDTSCINLPYAELLVKCKEIKNDIKVSKDQSVFAERETRVQSKNDKWFKL